MPTMPLKQALERGIALHESGRLDLAESVFRQLIAQHPSNPDVLNLLGVVLLKRKRTRDSADLFRQAIALRPDIAEFHLNLANALHNLGDDVQAEAHARQAAERKPGLARAWSLLGVALAGQHRRTEALPCYQHALELDPNDVDAHTNLGVCYYDLGRYQDALTEHRHAVRLRPDFAAAHLNLALILLLLGQEPEGWDEYEWRNQCEGLPKNNFRQPLWDGAPLEGRRILLYTEQGLGDAIQFVRFVPEVAKLGGRVALVCQKELKKLFHTVAGAPAVYGRDEHLPDFDVYAPLLSLARILKVRMSEMRTEGAYLAADPTLAGQWRERLNQDGPGFRVGLVWAGGTGHRKDRERSCPLASFAPLAQVPGVLFYSLQKGPGARQLTADGAELHLIDHTADLRDFADAAAFIANLDLVITVDTSVCHLAGALGKPTWAMIASVPHWGWGLESTQTTWYPTLRLFRQPRASDWATVIECIGDQLRMAIDA